MLYRELIAVFRRVRKIAKTTINLAMSVSQSVPLFVCIEQMGCHWMDFHKIWYLNFSKIYLENSSFVKIGQE